MRLLKNILKGDAESFIKLVSEVIDDAEMKVALDEYPTLYKRVLKERSNAQLNDKEATIIIDTEYAMLNATVCPCHDCGHYFSFGEGFYYYNDENHCEQCWRKTFPTDHDWDKHIIEETEPSIDLDSLSDKELEARAAFDAEHEDYCYYSEA